MGRRLHVIVRRRPGSPEARKAAPHFFHSAPLHFPMRLACAPCLALTSSLLRRPSVRSPRVQARARGRCAAAGPPFAPEFLVVDATPLLYAGHFAFEARPFGERLRTSNGVDTSVVYALLRSLLSLLRRSPSHLCVVFDPPGEGLGADGAPPPGWTAPWRPSSSTLLPSSSTVSAHHRTWRHHLFPDYKAQRQAPPQAVIDALPVVQRLLDACALPWLCVAGVEADDVIATLAARGAQAGLHTCVASLDKDFQQLVSPGLTLLRPRRGLQPLDEAPASSLYTTFTYQDFLEKYGGLEPKRFPELQARAQKARAVPAALSCSTYPQALVGDASDNIPGVAGIGAKTAPQLLLQHGSLDALFANVQTVLPPRARKCLEHADAERMARLSLQLAVLRDDVDVPQLMQDADAWRRAEPLDEYAAKAVLAQLEISLRSAEMDMLFSRA